MRLRVKAEQGDLQHPLVEHPEASSVSHCTPPSELPWVLEDTPAPTNNPISLTQGVFFAGGKAMVLLEWQELTPSAHRLE